VASIAVLARVEGRHVCADQLPWAGVSEDGPRRIASETRTQCE
jgi:hypothetical protein